MEVEGLGAKCNPNLSLVDVCGFNFHSGASEMTLVISLEKNGSIVCKKNKAFVYIFKITLWPFSRVPKISPNCGTNLQQSKYDHSVVLRACIRGLKWRKQVRGNLVFLCYIISRQLYCQQQ